MYKNAQLSLGILLGVYALTFGLIFALPTIIPDSTANIIDYYKVVKTNTQIQSEKIANFNGFPALSVLGHLTTVNSTTCNITVTVKNVGTDKAIDPTVKHIIVRDAEPGVTEGTQIGQPVYGGVWRNVKLYPGATLTFDIHFGVSNPALCSLLYPTPYYGQPRHQLQLNIKLLYHATTGHQFEETETVVVTPRE
jgi:hypothetical protein